MKTLMSAILILACLSSGYGFYKMNSGDMVSAIFFTLGILGIMGSVLRNWDSPQ